MALSRGRLSAAMASLPVPLQIGTNLSGYNYYTSSCPFINLIRGTDSVWSGAHVDANGWLSNLPVGQVSSKYVVGGAFYEGGYFLPGRYVVTWSGPLTIGLISSVATNKVTTDHRIEFDLPAITADKSALNWIQLQASNSSGADGSCIDVRVFNKNDEAALLSGEIFQSSFLDSLRGFSILRVMDWRHICRSGASGLPQPVNYSDIPTEASCSWVLCPISIIGKLAHKTKKDIMFNFNTDLTDAALLSIAQALWAETSGDTMKFYVEFSNEPWNTGAGEYNQILTTLISGDTVIGGGSVVNNAGTQAGLTNTDRVACGAAQGAMRCWKAMETYIPRNRIVRIYNVQGVNLPAFGGGFEYADTTGTLYAGAKMKTLVDAAAIAPYFGMSSGGTIGGNYGIPADMTMKAMITRNDYLNIDAWWTRAMQCSIDFWAAAVATAKAAAVAKRADIKLISYEGGKNFVLTLGHNWTATVVGGELDFGAVDMSQVFANGDEAVIGYDTTVLFTGWAGWHPYYMRIGSTNSKIKLYATQADYNSDTPATLTATAPNNGVWYVDNVTRARLLATRWRALLDSPVAAQWYRTACDAFRSAGILTFMQYGNDGAYQGYGDAVGGWGQNWCQWGAKRCHSETDDNYAIALWARRFALGC